MYLGLYIYLLIGPIGVICLVRPFVVIVNTKGRGMVLSMRSSHSHLFKSSLSISTGCSCPLVKKTQPTFSRIKVSLSCSTFKMLRLQLNASHPYRPASVSHLTSSMREPRLWGLYVSSTHRTGSPTLLRALGTPFPTSSSQNNIKRHISPRVVESFPQYLVSVENQTR